MDTGEGPWAKGGNKVYKHTYSGRHAMRKRVGGEFDVRISCQARCGHRLRSRGDRKQSLNAERETVAEIEPPS
jgi:hypothetical protein